MRAILFDIDGTLTATTNADNGCYESAFAKAFGFALPTSDWHCYTHVTDTGIIQEVMERSGRAPVTDTDIARFEEIYEGELSRSFAASPAGFLEVPGARTILEALIAMPGQRVALATGGMRRTALYKLRQIGVDGAAMAGAFANDALSRADIARLALVRTGVAADDVVYVGDGAWDVATAAELGIRFVGICREYARERLVAAGARVVVDDYRDSTAFLHALDTAPVPVRL